MTEINTDNRPKAPWSSKTGWAMLAGVIALPSFFGVIVDRFVVLRHDVPEGYNYLTKSDKGDFYYTKTGEKYESVQLMNVHVMKKDETADDWTYPVDCAEKTVANKTPAHRTVGYKLMQRACSVWGF